MSNNLTVKSKILIGTGVTLLVGGAIYVIYSSSRKKRISNKIFETLNNTSGEGFQDILKENQQILGSLAFNPNFWKGEGTVKPDPKFFNNFTTSNARDVAKNIYDAQAKWWETGGWFDDESKIVSEIKKLKSKGQVSLVAYAYQSNPLNYGNLANDIVNSTTGIFDSKIYIQQINNHINNLPY